MSKSRRTSPPPLRFHPDRNSPFHRLPFVGGRSPRGLGVSYWDVPEGGGYLGGCRTGDALARLYLQFLRRDQGPDDPPRLQNILLDMVGVEPDGARKGQVVGFFTVLEAVLAAWCREAGGGLDLLEAHRLLEEANAGLSFDEEEWLEARRREEGG